MRKILWLALLAVPIIVVLTLPARVVVPHIGAGEDVGEVSGTLWQGEAVWQQPGLVPVDLAWQWDGGRTWRWQAQGLGTDLEGRWRAAASGTELLDVSGRIDMDRLDARMWLLNARPRGAVELDIDRALVVDGGPPEIDGRLVWRDARIEGALHESLGEITVRMNSRVDSGQRQVASVETTRPGAVQVRGTIAFGADRYEVDLWLRPMADRPELARQIAWLGEPQPDGQVRVRLEGALGW